MLINVLVLYNVYTILMTLNRLTHELLRFDYYNNNGMISARTRMNTSVSFVR